MSYPKAVTLGFSFLLALALAGCGPSETPAAPKGADAAKPGAGQPAAAAVTPTPKPAEKPAAAAPAADSPEAAFKAVMKGMADGKPEVIWGALPKSYQKELQDDVVRAFAGKMDAEVYGKGVAVLKKTAALLKDKKDLLLPMVAQNPMVQMAQVDAEKLKGNWDKIVGFLDTLLASEIGDLERLKKADINSFLQVTGGKLMKQAADLSAVSKEDPYKDIQSKAAGSKIEVVKVEGDKATVKITAPGEPEKTEEMVRVEGKWLPKEMVDGWKEGVTDLKAKIAGLDLAAQKPQIMGGLAMAETTIDQLAKAKDAEEFMKIIGQVMGPLMGGMAPGGPGEGLGGEEDEPAPEEKEE